MTAPRIVAALLGLLLLAAAPAAADSIDDALFAPEEKCAYCHAIDGNSATARFPRLAGQRLDYLLKQLADFRAGRRRNDGGVMATNAELLDEPDIARVARHFSAQAPVLRQPAPDASPGAALYWQGRGAIPACAACHGGDAAPTRAPLLGGQHAGYLDKQLRDWRDGRRANDAAMSGVARQLSDQDIAALVAYLAATPRAAAVP